MVFYGSFSKRQRTFMKTDKLAKGLLLGHSCRTCIHSFFEIPQRDGTFFKQHLFTIDNQARIKNENLFCNYNFFRSSSSMVPAMQLSGQKLKEEKIPLECTCSNWEGVETTR
jgi:hypothetical protein